jgi:hypothetical protein
MQYQPNTTVQRVFESILKNNPENLNWKDKNYLKVPKKLNMEFAA